MQKIITILLFNISLLFALPNINEAKLVNRSSSNLLILSQDTVLKTGWYNVADFPEDNYPFMHIDKATGQYDNYYVIPIPIITSKGIQRIELINDSTPKLILHFDSEAAKVWSDITERQIGGTLVFVCDNKLIQVFRVKEKATTGIAEINRDVYNIDELNAFKLLIEKEKKQKP